MAEKTDQIQKTGKIQIPSRADRIGSEISVKLENKDYTEMLSPEEKQALELLFEKYGDNKGGLIQSTANRPGLGTFVDIKL